MRATENVPRSGWMDAVRNRLAGLVRALAGLVTAMTAAAFDAAELEKAKVDHDSHTDINQQRLNSRQPFDVEQIPHISNQSNLADCFSTKLARSDGFVERRRIGFLLVRFIFVIFRQCQPAPVCLLIRQAEEHSQKENDDCKFRDSLHSKMVSWFREAF
jgi:hypothetical protein